MIRKYCCRAGATLPVNPPFNSENRLKYDRCKIRYHTVYTIRHRQCLYTASCSKMIVEALCRQNAEIRNFEPHHASNPLISSSPLAAPGNAAVAARKTPETKKKLNLNNQKKGARTGGDGGGGGTWAAPSPGSSRRDRMAVLCR